MLENLFLDLFIYVLLSIFDVGVEVFFVKNVL